MILIQNMQVHSTQIRRDFLVIFCSIFLAFTTLGQTRSIKEKVVLHLNTSSLITGETLYLSANILNAESNRYSTLSSILYVELIDAENKPVYQAKVPIRKGKGNTDIFITSLIPTGTYQLIAYTKWMKNFDDYYHELIKVINPFEEYEVPEITKELNVSFYPEGGQILSGIENLVVLSVTDHQGVGVPFTARVVDRGGNNVTELVSIENGYGKFIINPDPEESYQLIIEDSDGNFKFVKFPTIVDEGNVLKVRDRGNTLLLSTEGTIDQNTQVVFQAQSNQNVLFEQEVIPGTNFALSKNKLTPGVNRLVVTAEGKLINDRLVYVAPEVYPLESQQMGTYETRSEIVIPISIEENARVSTSVNRIDNQSNRNYSVLVDQLLNGVLNKHIFSSKDLHGGNSEIMDMKMLMTKYKWDDIPATDFVHYLPDHRGEVISGKVNITDSLKSIGKNYVAFSIIGSDYQVRVAEVKEEGNFAVLIDPFKGDRTAYISNLNDLSGDAIILDEAFLKEYPPLEYPPVLLDSSEVKGIVDRSIRNQIENAYYEINEDTVILAEEYPEEFGELDFYYVLDDYNRFPTIRGSFVEYIPTVAARIRKSGASFRVSPKYVLPGEEHPPMAFLDGLPVNPAEILEFSPYRIESIGVINNRYFFGPLVVDGIITFRTKDGDLQGFTPSDYTREIHYKGLVSTKDYTFPTYQDSEEHKRIPDFRDQLYWNPDVEIKADDSYELQFYTSDTKGEFEVAIEGFTESGKPISIRKSFTVK